MLRGGAFYNALVQRIDLNDYLSVKSNWPRRLLGWEKYSVDRSEDQVRSEYDVDRYAPLLSLQSSDIEEYKVAEFAGLKMAQDDPMFISFEEEVFRTDVRTARMIWYAIIKSAVQRFATGRICELGCGYGYNLHMIGGDAYGGEYSSHAVQLGRRLGRNITAFNYYQPEQYEFIQPGSTILTVHSVEQLPSAECFVNGLAKVRQNVCQVVQLEPCFLPERKTFLGMIRNRYNELIDHNHDLVRLLRGRPDIEVIRMETDVFGLHPLNSSNLLVWRFR